jgi:hypothetical protein
MRIGLFAVIVGTRSSFRHVPMERGQWKARFLLIYQLHVPSLMKPFTVVSR